MMYPKSIHTYSNFPPKRDADSHDADITILASIEIKGGSVKVTVSSGRLTLVNT